MAAKKQSTPATPKETVAEKPATTKAKRGAAAPSLEATPAVIPEKSAPTRKRSTTAEASVPESPSTSAPKSRSKPLSKSAPDIVANPDPVTPTEKKSQPKKKIADKREESVRANVEAADAGAGSKKAAASGGVVASIKKSTLKEPEPVQEASANNQNASPEPVVVVVKPKKSAASKHAEPAGPIADAAKPTVIKEASPLEHATPVTEIHAKKAAAKKTQMATEQEEQPNQIGPETATKPVPTPAEVPVKKSTAKKTPLNIEPDVVPTPVSIEPAIPAPAPIQERTAPEPTITPAPKPVRSSSSSKKAKEPVRKVIVMPPTSTAPAPAPKPTVTAAPLRSEDRKPGVVVAQRRVDGKDHKVDTSKTMINYQPDYTRSILDTDPQPTGPVYRYSDEDLAEFREVVVTRLEASRRDLAYLQGLLTRKDEAGTDDSDNRYMNMEDGSGATEREQMAQLAGRQIQLINNLEKALVRIENKTYGICRVTGKLIDKARLRAVPHATLSIEAKNTMSKK